MSFTVYINEGEWDQICDWVLKYKDIETGGDLFGLWLDENKAVVQFVLGPGEKCRRTTTSFFQDVGYLSEAGKYLTNIHGLCNVGQWHSHHRINLFKPSVGDENTVWNNMPVLGLDRYIVFIANITDNVKIHCFLFQIKNGQQLSVKKGKFEVLHGNSPLRLNESILQNVHTGAESFNLLTTFEGEMKYIRNKDVKESGNPIGNTAQVYPETYNFQQKQWELKEKTPITSDQGAKAYPTSSPTKKGSQHIQTPTATYKGTNSRSVSAIVERPVSSGGIGKTKELDDDNSKQKLSVSVSVYHIPEAKRAVTLPRVSYDTKDRFINATKSSSVIQTNQGDSQQNNQSNISNVTPQSTSTVQDRGTVSSTSFHSTSKQPNNRAITSTTSNQYPNNSNVATTPKNTQQRAHKRTTPTTTRQDTRNYNTPTTLKDAQEREHKKTTPTTTGQCPQSNFPTTQRESKGKRPIRSEQCAKTYPTSNPTTESTQHIQMPSVKYNGTDSRTENAIVKQPKSSDGSSLKRKSGDYDNVNYEDETPQCKSSRPNIVYNTSSKDNLGTIEEGRSTPSGTFNGEGKQEQAEEGHHVVKQKEENYEIERSRSTWTDLFMINWCCGRMSTLNLNEPEVVELRELKKKERSKRKNKVDDDERKV